MKVVLKELAIYSYFLMLIYTIRATIRDYLEPLFPLYFVTHFFDCLYIPVSVQDLTQF